MYKQLTPDEVKESLGLPKDYRVDALIVYGGFKLSYKKKFLKHLKNKKYIIEKWKKQHPFLKPITSVKIKDKRIWICVEYGGARLSEFVHFASVFGSKINVLTGSCGALKKGIDAASIIVPEYSYSTESSCHMYLRNNKDYKFYPNKELKEKTIKLLQNKATVYSGPMMTCQAMMAETWEDIVDWSNKDFYGVEMEASTVFAVSEHYKVPAVAIVNVGDNLIEKEMVDSDSYRARRKHREELKKLIRETAVNLVLSYI